MECSAPSFFLFLLAEYSLECAWCSHSCNLCACVCVFGKFFMPHGGTKVLRVFHLIERFKWSVNSAGHTQEKPFHNSGLICIPLLEVFCDRRLQTIHRWNFRCMTRKCCKSFSKTLSRLKLKHLVMDNGLKLLRRTK